MSNNKSMIAIGIYNSAIQKRGMIPQEAFEELIMRLHGMSVDLKEVQMILGMNSSKMIDFNKGWIGQVPSIYRSGKNLLSILEKICFSFTSFIKPFLFN